MKDLPKLNAKDGSDKIDVEVGGQTEKDVAYVYFYRGPEENLTAIDKVKTAPAEENLVLSTPVSSQLQISGCGAATKAVIYSANGQMMTEASVCNGVTTINVEQLIKGIYIVKVGKKALKFIKK